MNLDFNPKPSRIMHIDLNSCFASIEQQANPLLRGKPMVVAAYESANGCVLAASKEAKLLGIKTGMRVKDARTLCPSVIIRGSDPDKYRNIHLALRNLFSDYTFDFHPKSIDEFVLNLEGYPCLLGSSMESIALEIKRRIKNEVGDWLTVSIGIAPNRYLAKIASNLKKPDGLSEINKDNFYEIYERLSLTDLTGIKEANARRLNAKGIKTVLDFYNAPVWHLKASFHSIISYYWYMRLHGYEIDDVEFGRRSYGNSYSLPISYSDVADLSPILSKLVEKTCSRLRRANYQAKGVHLAVLYKNGMYWHKGHTLPYCVFDAADVYREAFRLLCKSFRSPVRNIAVSVFNLKKADVLQLSLFEDVVRKKQKTDAQDTILTRWGDYVVGSARMLHAKKLIPDRIAFGGVKELEEFTRDAN